MTTRDRQKFLAAPMMEKSTDEDGNPLPVYRFTSDKMDTAGDIITREATEKAVEEWRRWRNIRLQHNPDKPIGKAVAIGEDGLAWNEMRVRVDDPDVIPLVEGDDPVLGAASVGIIVNDFELNDSEEAQERADGFDPWIITDYTMVEISLVDHPANYDAVRVENGQGLGRAKTLMRRNTGRKTNRRSLETRRARTSDAPQSVTERLQRNQRAIQDTTDNISDQFDRLIRVFQARRKAQRDEEKVSPAFIEKVTQLALEKLRPTMPVSSEQRVREIIRQEFMSDRVKRMASRYRRR